MEMHTTCKLPKGCKPMMRIWVQRGAAYRACTSWKQDSSRHRKERVCGYPRESLRSRMLSEIGLRMDRTKERRYVLPTPGQSKKRTKSDARAVSRPHPPARGAHPQLCCRAKCLISCKLDGVKSRADMKHCEFKIITRSKTCISRPSKHTS